MTSELVPYDYPRNGDGRIVTRRKGLLSRRPSAEAPPPETVGSIDWTMTHMFGEIEAGVRMLEGFIAGQGSRPDERWVEICVLYRHWEQLYNEGDLPLAPTMNQVCHALGVETGALLRDMQGALQHVTKSLAQIKAMLAVPQVVDAVIYAAISPDSKATDRDQALKLAGVIEPTTGLQINMTQQNAVVLKADRDKLKAPLLQFSETVDAFDAELRRAQIEENNGTVDSREEATAGVRARDPIYHHQVPGRVRPDEDEDGPSNRTATQGGTDEGGNPSPPGPTGDPDSESPGRTPQGGDEDL